MSKKQRIIVAIGGGELKYLETIKIDREIVKLTKKKRPKALFIPTASGDAEKYWETFQKVYGKKLGCITDVLFLIKEKYSQKKIKEKIMGADLIYVGGGNTYKMLRKWRRLKVDLYLKQAWKKGTIMSGLSAGSICWFKYGQSDSPQFTSPKNPKLTKLKALGFLSAIHAPHYYEEKKRHNNLKKMVLKSKEVGIGIDDNCALCVIDDKFHIMRSKSGMNAYKLFNSESGIIEEKIIPRKYDFRIDNLLSNKN